MAEESPLGSLNDAFQAAVNIKSAIVAEKRKNFESKPRFIQAGLYYWQKYQEVREKSIPERLQASRALKEEGTELFRQGEFEKGCFKYEEALTIFRYITSTVQNWKTEGIEDQDLSYFEETGSTENECVEIKELKSSIYLNIAACCLKIKDWKMAKSACDETLLLDPNNVKAYYRRSRVRTVPASAEIEDFKLALEDLERACDIEPENTDVATERDRVKHEIEKQTQRRKKTFQKILTETAKANKKEQEEEEETKKANKKGDVKKTRDGEGNSGDDKNEEDDDENDDDEDVDPIETEKEEAKRLEAIEREVADIENTIKQGTQFLQHLVQTGRRAEAEEFMKKLKELRKVRKRLLRSKEVDFENPTESMKKSAQKFGLDLNDPAIMAELRRLNEAKKKTGKYPAWEPTEKPELPRKEQEKEEKDEVPWVMRNVHYLLMLVGVVGLIITAIVNGLMPDDSSSGEDPLDYF